LEGFPNCEGEILFEFMFIAGDAAGFDARLEILGLFEGAAATITGAGFEAPSTFLNVSSTSAACHPAPTKADVIASCETPNFICAEIYSMSESCTITIIIHHCTK
jgi:hypothetical protein